MVTVSKGYTKNCSKEIFLIDSVLKTTPQTHKIKDVNEETIIRRFYEKGFCGLTLCYYPEPNSQIRNKFKVVLELSNHATKKELNNATGVDTCNLAAKSDFITLKAEVGELDIKKLVNVPAGLKYL